MTTPDLTWQRGTAVAMTGRVPLKVGQRWGFFKANDDGFITIVNSDEEKTTGNILPLVVVSLSPEGEVVLRPMNRELADKMFPEQEVVFKGKTSKARPTCPFHWVDADRAKGSKGAYQEGDLLAHEAWYVWTQMHVHQGDPVQHSPSKT